MYFLILYHLSKFNKSKIDIRVYKYISQNLTADVIM